MTSLARAKRYLAQKASRLALAVVPLAALAVSTPQAKAIPAGPLLTGGDCTVSGGLGSFTGSCDTAQVNATGGDGSLNWIEMFGSGSLLNSDGSGGFLNFNAGDDALSTVIPSGQIPVGWGFSISPVNPDLEPSLNWMVTFSIFTSGGSGSFTQSGSALAGSNVRGSGAIVFASSQDVIGWRAVLDTNTGGNAFGYSINIPGKKSLDLNQQTAAPEPASLLLLAPGLGALLFLRRKKRSSEKNS